jgi:hypothetical protein
MLTLATEGSEELTSVIVSTVEPSVVASTVKLDIGLSPKSIVTV